MRLLKDMGSLPEVIYTSTKFKIYATRTERIYLTDKGNIKTSFDFDFDAISNTTGACIPMPKEAVYKLLGCSSDYATEQYISYKLQVDHDNEQNLKGYFDDVIKDYKDLINASRTMRPMCITKIVESLLRKEDE